MDKIDSGYIYLIRCFGAQFRCIFLGVLQYFDEPEARVKTQRTSKNIQRPSNKLHIYYTTSLISMFLLKTKLFHVNFLQSTRLYGQYNSIHKVAVRSSLLLAKTNLIGRNRNSSNQSKFCLVKSPDPKVVTQ